MITPQQRSGAICLADLGNVFSRALNAVLGRQGSPTIAAMSEYAAMVGASILWNGFFAINKSCRTR